MSILPEMSFVSFRSSVRTSRTIELSCRTGVVIVPTSVGLTKIIKLLVLTILKWFIRDELLTIV